MLEAVAMQTKICIHDEDLSSHRFLGNLKAEHRNLIPNNTVGTQLIFASSTNLRTPMRQCTHSFEKVEKETTHSMGLGFFLRSFVRFIFDYPLMV